LVSDEIDYSRLRGNVSLLGHLLGETIAAAEGDDFLQLIEQIRGLSKQGREEGALSREPLLAILRELKNEQLVPVARAFSQFLNLSNIADQQHTVSRQMDPLLSASRNLADGMRGLLEEGVSREALVASIEELNIDLVLTAHPTEITRRTLIHKHTEIGLCLGQLELEGLTERERERLHLRLRELITQIWHGDDFRLERPSPVDEAKWGFAVVEDSLWQAVPQFLRRLDKALFDNCGVNLPLDAAPVSFTSWMGGDRDGNPNVTASVTQQVLLLSRWQVVDLYLADINNLVEELSMVRCSDSLRQWSGDSHEPYRQVLRELRVMLQRTRLSIEAELEGEPPLEGELLHSAEQLWQPLHACYQSLVESSMALIADGALLDLLRKVRCFGVHLVRHDVRQDSSRHTQVLSELTTYLGLGDYGAWEEGARQAFLLQELASRRPLIPPRWQPGTEAQEVLDTCAVVAAQSPDALGAYVISMARQPSDVLAVHLLLREAGCERNLPVAPLFETLDDLSRAREVVSTLLENSWYRGHIDGRLMVMIGYSDSAKDAGVLAASWAQYRAQEELLAICDQHGLELTLFHGRGGTIGRGGAPAAEALLSQPPGSLRHGLRVTEQGEMIRTKLGWTSLAVKTLARYTTAICRANLLTPPAPPVEWRDMMETLAEESCGAYRAVIRGEENFVAYFRHATPEQELAKLPLGSRPARRAGSGGIESLRAIPWIFAWSQNRLMLPAWLGAGAALESAVAQGRGELLRDMAARWPFFATRLSMLEMVFAKTDGGLSAYYDQCLVPPELQPIGDGLRRQLADDTATVLALRGVAAPLERAIMVTIAGIAAGMRNTG
jgi:phosphoenolpyruvate carboxylase